MNDLHLAGKSLKHENWEKQFESCNIARAVIVHHSEVLKKHYHEENIIEGLIAQSSSLRSAVSKNGLLAFVEIFESLKRLLDGELDNIFPVLLKRAYDTNIFISEPADQALEAMCTHCSAKTVL